MPNYNSEKFTGESGRCNTQIKASEPGKYEVVVSGIENYDKSVSSFKLNVTVMAENAFRPTVDVDSSDAISTVEEGNYIYAFIEGATSFGPTVKLFCGNRHIIAVPTVIWTCGCNEESVEVPTHPCLYFVVYSFDENSYSVLDKDKFASIKIEFEIELV